MRPFESGMYTYRVDSPDFCLGVSQRARSGDVHARSLLKVCVSGVTARKHLSPSERGTQII